MSRDCGLQPAPRWPYRCRVGTYLSWLVYPYGRFVHVLHKHLKWRLHNRTATVIQFGFAWLFALTILVIWQSGGLGWALATKNPKGCRKSIPESNNKSDAQNKTKEKSNLPSKGRIASSLGGLIACLSKARLNLAKKTFSRKEGLVRLPHRSLYSLLELRLLGSQVLDLRLMVVWMLRALPHKVSVPSFKVFFAQVAWPQNSQHETNCGCSKQTGAWQCGHF